MGNFQHITWFGATGWGDLARWTGAHVGPGAEPISTGASANGCGGQRDQRASEWDKSGQTKQREILVYHTSAWKAQCRAGLGWGTEWKEGKSHSSAPPPGNGAGKVIQINQGECQAWPHFLGFNCETISWPCPEKGRQPDCNHRKQADRQQPSWVLTHVWEKAAFYLVKGGKTTLWRVDLYQAWAAHT